MLQLLDAAVCPLMPGPLTLCAFAANGLFAAVPLREEGAQG